MSCYTYTCYSHLYLCHGFWAFYEQMAFYDRYFLLTKVDIPKSNNAVKCMAMVHSAVLGSELVLAMFLYACVVVLRIFPVFSRLCDIAIL
jgi:hypothetical protein